MVLLSNMVLLEKYQREIPQTWDELKDTSKYILTEELKNNNTELMAYNGLFDSKYYEHY